ncbi:hypothetical protein LCGC14_1169430 [marine sediment metagenome]|uniref:Uncharacterized protein n=1 Tax=marine sediment metagenome TaxID=412755 RepID=A0A0F9LV73_9ZZZZ
MPQAQAGETVDKIVMTIDGIDIQVITPNTAAYRMNYEPSYICQLCDEGKLIATKIFGRWWLHLDTDGNIKAKGVTV